jgi:hypothetical protein
MLPAGTATAGELAGRATRIKTWLPPFIKESLNKSSPGATQIGRDFAGSLHVGLLAKEISHSHWPFAHTIRKAVVARMEIYSGVPVP